MTSKSQSRNDLRQKRHSRVRGKVKGSSARPRLVVFKSSKFLYAQVIDDVNNKVLVSADSRKIAKSKGSVAEEIGKLIADKSAKKGIKKVVFDRGGYKYHGNVKLLAEAVRKAGLEF